jgi:hypothetical protein
MPVASVLLVLSETSHPVQFRMNEGGGIVGTICDSGEGVTRERLDEGWENGTLTSCICRSSCAVSKASAAIFFAVVATDEAAFFKLFSMILTCFFFEVIWTGEH